MYWMSGWLRSRYGDDRMRSFTWMFCFTQSFLSCFVASSSIETCTASSESCRAAIA